MNFLFAPAIALLKHMRYSAKFTLVAVIAVFAFGYLLYSKIDSATQSVNFTREELRGLRVLQPYLQTIVQMQQHRGLSAGVLNGNEAMREPLNQKTKAVEEAMKTVDTVLQGDGADYKLQGRWQEIRNEWGRLAMPAGLQLTAKESFAAHTQLIGKLMVTMQDIGDMSNLILDPEASTYYLVEPLLRSAPELTERLGRLRARGNGILSRKELDDAARYDITHQLGELEHSMSQLEDRLVRAARVNPNVESRLQQQLAAQHNAQQGVIKVIREEILSQRFGMEPKAYFELTTQAIGVALKTVNEVLMPLAKTALEDRVEKESRDLWITVVLSVGMVMIAGYFSVAIWIVVLQSVAELEEGARYVAKGDLTHQIHFSADDELKAVATQFNLMVQEFANVVRQIQHNAESVHAGVTELNRSAQNVVVGSEQQSEAATRVAAAMEEMSSGVGEISHHASSAEGISAESGRLSQEGGTVVERSVTEMGRIEQAVQQSAQAMRELGEQSSQISVIVNSIKEIADQTNLLALNAAIEAARAGETGRGFAVVADEVRKLAERTAKATDEITGMVGSIQVGTNHAIQAMEAGVGRVREGVELTRQAGQSMSAIRDGAQTVVVTVGDISVALREQTAASAEIAQNVEMIARMAESNVQAVRQTAYTASGLESSVVALAEGVKRFRV